ncbi:MAG TPA: hypothetical protein VG675_02580 [Bryobacteraceae bacterium]|nr:hypothetical protein [Bryobacteraceae bacterium]
MAVKVFQAGYMSGDTYSASAYLAVEPEAQILLIKDTKEPQDKTDNVVYKFYQECGLGGRVKLLNLSTSTVKVKEVWRAFNDAPDTAPKKVEFTGVPATVEQTISALYYKFQPLSAWPRSIVSVTGLLANKFESAPVSSSRKVAELWKIGKFDTATKFALWEYAGNKFRKTGFDIRKNILVLWSRQSGKRGGAHLELDTSYAGIRQLVNYFAVDKATVVLAGDESKGKLAEIASGYTQVVNVAEMWKDDFWKKHFAGVNVLAQLAFFKFLAEDYNVVHLGMRSGMLETMALLGMPVFYMEPAPSPSGDRMLAFSRSGIPYSRIQIDEPPGLTGLAAQQTIESGIPAPSLSVYQDKVEKGSSSIKKFVPFQKSYGSYDRRSGTVTFGSTGDKAARSFAKASIVGREDKQSIKDGTVIRDTKRLRGFTNSDFEKIVARVEAAFKK